MTSTVELVSTPPASDSTPGGDAPAVTRDVPLRLVATRCPLCDHDDGRPVAVGEDFEYRTSPDTFLAAQCRNCDVVYLTRRPAAEEIERIYPPDYHAFDFTPERYGFVYRVRRRLEARRLLRWCRDLPADARIVDVGCGDGFHLALLRDYGSGGWHCEGVDASARAVAAATRRGFTVHHGPVESAPLDASSFDLALLIMTVEHTDDPAAVLRAIGRVLKPGGRVVIVTDNTDTADFRLFGGRHWGGYHFPRHFCLFNARSLHTLAQRAGLSVDSITTAVSPINWVYSLRNLAVDWGAPRWVINRFHFRATVALSIFTAFDTLNSLAGRGALLHAVLRRPA